jgi:GntR family transcriptional regulator
LLDFEIDYKSGVPLYRQIMDQILHAIAVGTFKTGDKLPTVRQLAVDLSINPNTVSRAYHELEIRDILVTQMGTGTFIADKKIEISDSERRQMLDRICQDFISRASAYGFSIREIAQNLDKRIKEEK